MIGNQARSVCSSVFVALVSHSAIAALPDADTVMKNVLHRSQETALTGDSDKYSYQKHSIEEELDASGKPIKTTDKTYQVVPILGVPFSRLIKIQNRDLTEKETREQDKKEQEFRKKLAERQPAQIGATNKEGLDEQLISRFVFQVEGQETLHDRPVLILSFHPKPNNGREKTVGDKVLARLAGTLWVDEQEWEIAQLKLGLTAELSLGWFGMVGSIKQFDLAIERARLPDGVWVDTKQTLELGGRKVFSTMHFRNVEESTNFRKP
ncbi:MAG TPA: hypothetical protein VL361_20355 [Candidatus Limnocylindrales bacterium]|jgi:hypothetical protein|nr:hypothetical protein [Candidatus Limnocylindrales bacterium]